MMEVQFVKDSQPFKITTNNQKDIDYFLQNGYYPESVQFVPGPRKNPPEPVEKRISITNQILFNEVQNTRNFGKETLNAEGMKPDIKITKRDDPEVLNWCIKSERFHKHLSPEDFIEGSLALEKQITLTNWRD